MKIFTFSFFSDLVFCALSSFLLCLVTSSYFLQNPFNLILSICFCLLFTLFAFKCFYYKRTKKRQKEQLQKEQNELCTQLCFYSKPKLLTLFEKAFSKKGLLVEKRTTHLILPSENQAIFFVFSFDGVKKADVVKAFNKLKENQIAVIYSADFFDEIKNFASRFKGRILLKNSENVYSLLKETALLPQISCDIVEEKNKRVTVKNFLQKKNATRYFLFGGLFLLMSFIVPFKIYYVIAGSVLMIFSLILKFFVKEHADEKAN